VLSYCYTSFRIKDALGIHTLHDVHLHIFPSIDSHAENEAKCEPAHMNFTQINSLPNADGDTTQTLTVRRGNTEHDNHFLLRVAVRRASAEDQNQLLLQSSVHRANTEDLNQCEFLV
jgi:hypothetical protein